MRHSAPKSPRPVPQNGTAMAWYEAGEESQTIKPGLTRSHTPVNGFLILRQARHVGETADSEPLPPRPGSFRLLTPQ